MLYFQNKEGKIKDFYFGGGEEKVLYKNKDGYNRFFIKIKMAMTVFL